MGRQYFGTDGIRGRVGSEPITADFMLKLGWAAGRVLGEGKCDKILIGKDTRISGYMFESVLEAGLTAAGMDVMLLGPMPTPGIAYLTRTLHCCAGIVISASHNPYYDNGVKFFSAEGTKLPDEIEERIEAEIGKPMTTVESNMLGKAERVRDAAGRYIEFCKSTVPMHMNLHGMKIVVDCAHGATYHIAPSVLDELGAEVIPIGVNPNGLNINENIGSTKPEKLREKVLEEKADLGIGFDGDGDRLIMIDHTGDIVDGDELLFIIARSRQRANKLQGGVVGTLMTNLGLEHALQRFDVPLLRANVGDRYVLELLKQNDWLIGGESSGHIICLDRTSTGDGIVSALQVLFEIYDRGESLADLRKEVTKYPQHMINVAVENKAALNNSEEVAQAVTAMEKRLAGRGRVLLRPSGTEPVVRVMVEGEDADLVVSTCDELAGIVQKALASQ